MKKELKLSYVKVKKLQPNSNSMKAMILRQQYAMRLLSLIDIGKRIINVDETWLNETSFSRKVWATKNSQGNFNLNAVAPRISMIAAIDTSGKAWFSLSHATTDSDVMAVFFYNLVQTLD